MNLLFICNQGRHRSKTAEMLFRPDYRTRSAGLYSLNPVQEKDLLWADVIFVMEDGQRTEIARRFPRAYLQKRILSLGIPDVYQYNQPELVSLLKEQVPALLEPFLEFL